MTAFTVTDHPEFSPAACVRCQAGDTKDQLGNKMREYFVDLGIQFDYEGELYLCNKCLEDIWVVCPDKVSLREYNEMVNQLTEAQAQNAQLDRVKGKLELMGFDWEVLVGDGPILVNGRRTLVIPVGTAAEVNGAGTANQSEFVAPVFGGGTHSDTI